MNTQSVRGWKAVSGLVVSTVLVVTTLFTTPALVVLAASTGYRSPTADVAGTGGDNDGFESDPTYAYDDDGNGYAASINTCRGNQPSGCIERHIFYDYGFTIPADAVIQGIEVRADWWLDSITGNNSLTVDLSWDGGTSWTSPLTDTIESTSERTMVFGGADNTWGRTWSSSEVNSNDFLVRVNIITDQQNARDFWLDWIPVQITYNQSPNAPTNQTPASGAFTASGNPQFTWSAFSDPNSGDTQSAFQLQTRTEEGAYGDASSQDSGSVASAANTYTPVAWNLGDGTYCWHVRVQDNSGATNAGSDYGTDTCFTVDTTPPTSQATPPTGPINTPPIAVPWTADGAVSGIATGGILLRYNLNGGTYVDGPTASGTSGTFDFSPPSGDGTYCFYTVATDNAGNVEAAPGDPHGDGCTVFNTPPVAADDDYSTPEDTPLTVVAALGVLANDSDADGNPLTAAQDADPASGTLVFNADGSFVYTPTLDFDGVVTFTYHANDGMTDSNIAAVTITVTAVNDAPTFTSTPVVSATEETAYTYNVTATDVDNAATDLTITAPTLPGWLTLTDNGDGTATLTGAPTNADTGDQPVVLQASDGAITTTQPFTITVTAVNDAPTFTSTPVVSATEDVAYTYNVTAADVDNAATDLTITAPTLPGWLALADNGDGTARLTGTPTHTNIGDNPVVLQVYDGDATTTQPFTITVTAVNHAPLAVADDYSTPEDTPLTVVAALGVLANDSDADGNPLTAAQDAGPASGTLVFNADGSFVYTPTLNFNGTVTFTYHASDGMVNSNIATVAITVTAVNDAPTFTSTPVVSATEGIAYTYNVTAADVDNAVIGLTIAAPTLPGWLTLTDNHNGTARLTGTPTHTNIGDNPVVLQVYDGDATTTQPFTIAVSAKGTHYIYLPVVFRTHSG